MTEASVRATREVLRAFGIRPSKRWGQHFLVSDRVLRTILEAASLSPQDVVVEVGAGIGTLTVALAQRAGCVVAIEVDRHLVPALRAATAPYPHVRVVEADVLAVDLDRLLAEVRPGGERKAVANLPYNIGASVLVRLLDPQLGLSRVVVMVQKEVADRIVAAPGTPAYGRLSLAVQYRGTPRIVARVSRGAFLPRPDVESALVVILPHASPPVAVPDEDALFRVIAAGFGHRRKILTRALCLGLGLPPSEADRACRAAGLDPRARAETLSLDQFAALARALHPLPERDPVSPSARKEVTGGPGISGAGRR